MRRALRLAAHGRGRTAPNPAVGAVVVTADGSVAGEGYHARAGEPHAEVIALEAAGARAAGATLFLTLEPCTHEGRTPACAPRVIASGVSRVVMSVPDPSPNENGAGIAALRAAGIAVDIGVAEREGRELIAGFACRVGTGRPLVTIKMASSLDGRAAAADGSSRWITGPTARRDVHRLRAWADAVMVGTGTVLADDPALTVRLRGYEGRGPLRVVLDSSARTPLDAAVLSDAAPTLICTTAKAPEDAVEALRARGATVERFGARDGRVDVAAVLDHLGRVGLCDVLVEGGPTVAGELVDRALVDRYVFYLAPKLLGQVGVGTLSGVVVPNIADARELTIDRVRRVGADVKIEARPRI
jgi:diaminohydroxyphosphoribosylaminopyrimidine deaminase/5-amino-6-(5-phosphoribosylamino)uracil reductase